MSLELASPGQAQHEHRDTSHLLVTDGSMIDGCVDNEATCSRLSRGSMQDTPQTLF